jgi:hypothetical protein
MSCPGLVAVVCAVAIAAERQRQPVKRSRRFMSSPGTWTRRMAFEREDAEAKLEVGAAGPTDEALA